MPMRTVGRFAAVAIQVVSNTRVAYLSRIAFGENGEGAYRVFYNNMAEATRWLDEVRGDGHRTSS